MAKIKDSDSGKIKQLIQKTVQEITKELVQKIFNEQHTDSGAKMIILSTIKIAHIVIEEKINLCSYILQELALKDAKTCDITKSCLEELLEMKKELELNY